MTPEQTFVYKVSPDNQFEIFDDETVVINLRTGNYYSLGGVASEIWELITSETSFDAIVASLQQRYQGETGEIEQAINELLADWETEGMILRVETAAVNNTPASPLPATSENQKLSFPHPTYEKFTDATELLLLDPIHEVDEHGWPHAKPVAKD